MAEQRTSSRESDPEDVDVELATGIGVVINIDPNHLTTINNATGSHTRNLHLTDGGSNSHVGKDSHDGSTAISGTIHGPNLAPQARDSSEVRSRSVPLAPRPPPPEHITSDSPNERLRSYIATYPGHTMLSFAHPHPPYIDKPPHQDVAIQHIHCEPEASLQTGWIDSQLLGRVIELSAEDTRLYRRTMAVMAVSTGARFLQRLKHNFRESQKVLYQDE